MTKRKFFFRVNQVISPELVTRFQSFLIKINEEKIKKEDILICLVFDSVGGYINSAIHFVNTMKESNFEFCSIAYKQVDSAAVIIFLSSNMRIGKLSASALIHRIQPLEGDVLDKELEKSEKQAFKIIANAIKISLLEVYELADKDTIIKKGHPLAQDFFTEM